MNVQDRVHFKYLHEKHGEYGGKKSQWVNLSCTQIHNECSI